MPVNLEITENGWIVIYRILDPWTVRELESVYPEHRDHHESAKHTVHVLVDASLVRSIPPNALTIRREGPAFEYKDTTIAIVSTSLFAQRISETIFRLVHFEKAKFFNKTEDGLNFLRSLIVAETNPKILTR